MDNTAKQFQKFLGVGLISTAINYGLFFISFRFFHIHYIVSSVVGYCSGVLFGFSVNRSWTFRSLETRKYRELFFYLMVYFSSLILSILFLRFLVLTLYLSPLLANIFAIGLSTVTNFLGCKLLVFQKVRI